jgi:hypothetical protein
VFAARGVGVQIEPGGHEVSPSEDAPPEQALSVVGHVQHESAVQVAGLRAEFFLWIEGNAADFAVGSQISYTVQIL